MLHELRVRNVVIVGQAVLECGPGLTVISGETGAGKSLLLDALHLLLGGRGRSELVGPDGDAAVVSGVFSCRDPAVLAQLREEGLLEDDEEQLIIRRRLQRNGRSEAWVGDAPVGMQRLRRLGQALVDIRVQHEHLRLGDPARQAQLLDRYGGLTASAEAYRAEHRAVGEISAELARLESGDRDSMKELDYLRFTSRELQELAPEAGEHVALVERQRLLAGAQGWMELAGETVEALEGSELAPAPLLAGLARRLRDAPHADLREAGELCSQAAELLREAVLAGHRMLSEAEVDPAELARVDERLAAFEHLLRKHGGSEESLLATWQHTEARIAELENLDARRAELSQALRQRRAERQRLGVELAAARAAAFAGLQRGVQQQLRDLGMPKARFELSQRQLDEPTALGVVEQQFLVATNPGQAAGPIAAVASGGEAARMTLALAVVLADQDETPVLVFDEVDAGVGGRLGTVMGDKLAALGERRTVLVVTHTPQLAARADRHYLVDKEQGEDRTEVRVRELSGTERIDELAAMLGGGKAARQQASSLMLKGIG